MIVDLFVRRQPLTQLFWKPRHLSRMLRHQRKRFDFEDEAAFPCRECPDTSFEIAWRLRRPGRLIVTEADYDAFLHNHPLLATAAVCGGVGTEGGGLSGIY